MVQHQFPVRQGLYDPNNEHDACGIGFIAHIKGESSHNMVKQGIHMLCQLEHRGGQGSDPESGDGAGIMIQIPHEKLVKECNRETFSLPDKGMYGVGMLFLPLIDSDRKEYEDRIEMIIREEGQDVLGWRTVPVDETKLGEEARKSQPFIGQVFVDCSNLGQEYIERKLFVIRKRIEHALQGTNFYAASFSSQTLVYKGMVTPDQLDQFYLDLADTSTKSAFALVHSRFSTNTFPSWERAHPNRYIIHNGEINTLKGNVNWMKAREQVLQSDQFGQDLKKVTPIIDENGSDSSMLDNALEFLTLAGYSLPHAVMMMIPEPWDKDSEMQEDKRAFYEYHSSLMEPWDGPTAISFTNGKQIGAVLDRNGLRPARYYVTNDDYIIFSSEVGVIDIPEEKIVKKDRLSPGKMLLVDLEQGRIIDDEELKGQIIAEKPYQQWLEQELVIMDHLPEAVNYEEIDYKEISKLHKLFGYTYEELDKNLKPMVTEGKDPIGSMGNDTPLAVLSDRPQLLYNYFKQLFAQVTNPPIDAIREACVTSTLTFLGAEGDLLNPTEDNCHRIRLDSPIITNEELAKLKYSPFESFKATTLPLLFKANVVGSLEQELEELFNEAEKAITTGHTILVLSDKRVNKKEAAMPALLAVSGLHHYLVKKGLRTKVSLVVETGEARDVHQFACLIGYGADAINPYLGIATIKNMIQEESIENILPRAAIKAYVKAAVDGIVKVMSKMGISTVQSYRGAQIFEAIGIHENVINRYFYGTASQISGIDLQVIEKETLLRHELAFDTGEFQDDSLEPGSDFQWRKDGEFHAFNPKTIHTLQHACRSNNYELYKTYSKMANDEQIAFLRSAFSFDSKRKPIPIESVESVESIVKRFKTGAMSYGSLSEEAHETLAIAMNRIGGKSNSGEGGEASRRFTLDENGDNRRSAIKQVASGRFGVTSEYLVNADEIQIKMAQGAKPGEGGHLPGKKVYPWVAEVRGSTPGVGLISPPPHHDIYSIEDLAQLIHDLKNANPKARISVKLVSKSGVGTIAAGVAKGLADVILISGYEGGTGASPRTSIKHTGLPWEIGLAETHQTLLLNGLRDRVAIETDGKMMTGRDVVMATLLGAEEYGFSTAPLVILGCIMMRVCHNNTCPVGIATQDPKLRKKYMGSPDHVVNYMYFVAQEVRELMAELGFRTINEMVGQTDVLTSDPRLKNHWKTKGLNLSRLLYQPKVPDGATQYNSRQQDHKLEKSIDIRELLPIAKEAIELGKSVEAEFNIRNIDRVVGTIVGHEITSKYGNIGLPEDMIKFSFTGSAGQSFGAFVPKGMTLKLTGDSNDYVGKGLSGGKLIIKRPEDASYVAENNIIIGNVALYGATSGEVYINGKAGERFAVRNSGVDAVVEGVGDHGCEYMTGGRVVILGEVGKNFAAGMSGGEAYVLGEHVQTFKQKCNRELVDLERLNDMRELHQVKHMIERHYQYTKSSRAKNILDHWDKMSAKIVKVIPREYRQMQTAITEYQQRGLTDDQAKMKAFEDSKRQTKNDNKDTLVPAQNY